MPHTRILLLSLLIATPLFVVTSHAHAVSFTPMVPIPGISGGSDFGTFIETAYIVAIIAAAFIAVGRLIIAGFKYVLSAVVTDKMSAKKDIEQALVGLLIVLCAVAVLRVINPKIGNLSVLESVSVPDIPRAEVCVTKDETGRCITEAEKRELEGEDKSIVVETNSIIRTIEVPADVQEYYRYGDIELLGRRWIDEQQRLFLTESCGCTYAEGSNRPTGCEPGGRNENRDRNGVPTSITLSCKRAE